jgi:hypothetical protein
MSFCHIRHTGLWRDPECFPLHSQRALLLSSVVNIRLPSTNCSITRQPSPVSYIPKASDTVSCQSLAPFKSTLIYTHVFPLAKKNLWRKALPALFMEVFAFTKRIADFCMSFPDRTLRNCCANILCFVEDLWSKP